MEELIILLVAALIRALRGDKTDEGAATPQSSEADVEGQPLHELRESAQTLLSRVEELIQRTEGKPGAARLYVPLRGEALDPLRRFVDGIPERAPAWQYRAAVDQVAYYGELVTTLETMTDQRLSTRDLEIVGDADAVADACYSPVIQFCHAQGIPLRSAVPIAMLDADPAVDLFFKRSSIAPMLVPDDFRKRLLLWPAIAHEVAHDFFVSVDGLEAELHRLLVLPVHLALPIHPGYVDGRFMYSLFGPWLTEVFADVLGTLMLGPAYVETMRRAFERPGHPEEAAAAWSHGDYLEAHPPGHVRVIVGCQVLTWLGRHEEARDQLSSWRAAHGGLDHALIPLRGDQGWFPIGEPALLESAQHIVGTLLERSFTSLAGHKLMDVPGFFYLHDEHARVVEMMPRLARGEDVRGDPRLVLAAGVLAAAGSASARQSALTATRRSIVGVGAKKKRRRKKRKRPSGSLVNDVVASASNPKALVEAMVVGAAFSRRAR